MIRDVAHNAWLRSAVDAAGGTTQSFWIGLNDVATEGTWRWTNNTPLSYTNWDSGAGEPNSSGGNEDYGHIKANGKWNDEKNTTSLRSVIEVEASCITRVLTSGTSTASGSSFPVGTTTVSYQSTDAAGNSSTCSFNVVVTDATAPSFGVTPSVLGYVPSTGCMITAPNYPTPTDNCPGVTVEYVSGPNPGDALTPGSYQMKYRARDAAGLFSAEQTMNVTVQDTVTPTITGCPAGINVGTSPGLCTGVASWNAPGVSDNCSGSSIVQTAGPVSGTPFPIGLTTITYTATDTYSNTRTCSFNVNVVDSEPGTITCPNDTTIAQEPGQCFGTYMYAVPEIHDNCGGPWAALFSRWSSTWGLPGRQYHHDLYRKCRRYYAHMRIRCDGAGCRGAFDHLPNKYCCECRTWRVQCVGCVQRNGHGQLCRKSNDHLFAEPGYFIPHRRYYRNGDRN